MPGPGTCSAGPCSWYGDHKCICADKGLYPQMVADRRPPPNPHNIGPVMPAPGGTPSQLLPKTKQPMVINITANLNEIGIILDSVTSKLTGNGKWISPQMVEKILEDIESAKELLNSA